MAPLHPVSLGLVIVALVANAGGWDLLPDPVGWLLVLWGIQRMPHTARHQGPLLTATGLALAISCALWPPTVRERLADLDESLSWALSLPQLAALVLLSLSLRYAARQAGDTGRARWFTVAATLAVAAAVLPVLVFGGGLTSLAGLAALTATLGTLLLVALCLAAARAPWAGGDAPGDTATRRHGGPTRGRPGDSRPKSAPGS